VVPLRRQTTLVAVVAGHPPPVKVVTFAGCLLAETLACPHSLCGYRKGIGGIIG